MQMKSNICCITPPSCIQLGGDNGKRSRDGHPHNGLSHVKGRLWKTWSAYHPPRLAGEFTEPMLGCFQGNSTDTAQPEMWVSSFIPFVEEHHRTKGPWVLLFHVWRACQEEEGREKNLEPEHRRELFNTCTLSALGSHMGIICISLVQVFMRRGTKGFVFFLQIALWIGLYWAHLWQDLPLCSQAALKVKCFGKEIPCFAACCSDCYYSYRCVLDFSSTRSFVYFSWADDTYCESDTSNHLGGKQRKQYRGEKSMMKDKSSYMTETCGVECKVFV